MNIRTLCFMKSTGIGLQLCTDHVFELQTRSSRELLVNSEYFGRSLLKDNSVCLHGPQPPLHYCIIIQGPPASVRQEYADISFDSKFTQSILLHTLLTIVVGVVIASQSFMCYLAAFC